MAGQPFQIVENGEVVDTITVPSDGLLRCTSKACNAGVESLVSCEFGTGKDVAWKATAAATAMNIVIGGQCIPTTDAIAQRDEKDGVATYYPLKEGTTCSVTPRGSKKIAVMECK